MRRGPRWFLKSIFFSFLAGVVAAACLPHAGWTNFMWDLTPWNFPVFAAAIGALYFLIQSLNLPLEGGGQVLEDLGGGDKNISAYPPHPNHPPSRGRGLYGSALSTFLISYTWAFGYFVFGLSWVGNALLVGGNPYAWAAPFASIGLPLLLACFMGVTFGGIVFIRRVMGKGAITPPLFVVIFTLAEYARGHFFTGFPWNLMGYYWSETLPIFQTLSVTGIDGLSLLTVLWALGLCLAASPTRRAHGLLILIALITFAASMLYGHIQLNAAPGPTTPLQIRMVQANIPQSEKWDSEKMVDHFYRHLGLSYAPKDLSNIPTVILWPETALPSQFVTSTAIQSQIADMIKTYPPGSVLLTGSMRIGADDTYYNSVTAFDATGTPHDIYDKHHLVPFGEYMPFARYMPIKALSEFDGLGAGPGPATITLPGIPAFSPLICYEVIFPGNVVAAHDATRPTWLANFTNDSWYADSPGPRQHLAAARARAIEQGLPLVRVAETGISASFDPKGRTINDIKYGTAAAKTAVLQILITPEITIFSILAGKILIIMISILLLLPKYYIIKRLSTLSFR